MLTGQYQHNIDAKGRISIPAKLREDLGERFVVSKGTEHCLTVYPMGEWNRLQKKIDALPVAKAQKLHRFFSANADTVELDKQGRIVLAGHLREFAGLTGQAVVVGVSNSVEIWDKERWDAQCASITAESVEALMDEIGF